MYMASRLCCLVAVFKLFVAVVDDVGDGGNERAIICGIFV